MINPSGHRTETINYNSSHAALDNRPWRPRKEASYSQVRNRSAIAPALEILAGGRGKPRTNEDEVKIPTWAVSAFGFVLVGCLATIGALLAIIFGSATGDIKDLKTDVKETRAAIQTLTAAAADLGKQTAVTNTRLDATNEKLQTLIDETRKRR